MIGRVAHRLRSLFGRGKVTLADDSGVVQMLQIDLGPIGPDGQSLSIRDKAPRVGEFGLASNPPLGTHAVVLHFGGDRSNSVVIGTNHQTYRLKNLNPGETALYDHWGNTVVLTEAGMTLTHTAKITLSAPIIELDANDVRLAGAGGAAVARVGDPVSSGTISSGSTKVTSK